MLVVDYTDIIDRYQGLSIDEIEERLDDEDELLSCLQLPRELGVSGEWVRLYGFPLANEAPDLITRRFTSADYPDLRDNLVAQFLAPFRGVSSIVSEHMAPTLAGDVIVRSHWKAPIQNDTPDYSRIVIVDLDVSDLRETERALEEAVESKDRLMATLAHELRNPLTAVVGFSSILSSEWDALDDDARREMAGDITSQVGDVSSLLDDFLTFNVDALRVEDVSLWVESLLAGVDLSGVDVELNPNLVVSGDPVRIRQIIRNLVRNAERHGGASRTLTGEPIDDIIRIRVSDDGPGVPSDVLERLFEPFSHGSSAGSLGLGLAVSQRLARAMGGDLRYERSDGKSSFVLDLRVGNA
jgi:signal transduction histidine kinase